IGVAECSPATPTSGVTNDAKRNCAAPMTAAPAPRVEGVASASPRALEFDIVKPVPAVSTNAVTTNPGTDRLLVVSITTNDAAAMMSNTEPNRYIVPTPRWTAIRELMRLARMIAEAAAAKLSAYGSCPIPSIDWPTKGDAAISRSEERRVGRGGRDGGR